MDDYSPASENPAVGGMNGTGEQLANKAAWERPTLKSLSIFEAKGGWFVSSADAQGFS